MNGSNSITHHTKVVPSESKSLMYEATMMLAHTNLQEVQEERTERRWKRLNHSSIRFWVSLILSPYFPNAEFCLGRLFFKEYSTIHVYEDIGLREIDPHRQNSLMLPVEKFYTQHLSQEKSRRGYLNEKGIPWDGYPLRLFLQVLNYSSFASMSDYYEQERSDMILRLSIFGKSILFS